MRSGAREASLDAGGALVFRLLPRDPRSTDCALSDRGVLGVPRSFRVEGSRAHLTGPSPTWTSEGDRSQTARP